MGNFPVEFSTCPDCTAPIAAVYVHVIFSTKNREPLIEPEIETELYKYLATACKTAKSPAIIVGGRADHIHLLVQLGRKTCVADLVEEIKTSTSRWIKTKGRGYRGFYWQSGYGAFSIGKSGVPACKGYIARQKKHHLIKSSQEEYREFLRKYEVEYDERYVWD